MPCERRPIPKNRGGARSERYLLTEQTPAVILAKMRFFARREVGRAPFWICDGPLRALEALGIFDARSCYLSLIFKHSYTKWGGGGNSVNQILGGGRLLAPL